MANTEPIKSMLTQPLALTGVPVSRVALGCMGLSGTWDPKQFDDEKRRRAIASFEAAMTAGITFYDHADIYGGGTCEAVFKDCLAAVPGSRERIFIATKAAIRFDSGSVHYDHSPAYLRESLRRSLDRLGVDYVDLYLPKPPPCWMSSSRRDWCAPSACRTITRIRSPRSAGTCAFPSCRIR